LKRYCPSNSAKQITELIKVHNDLMMYTVKCRHIT